MAGRRLRVVVVDDEPIVGRRLKPALEKGGFEVEVFADPTEAAARLAAVGFDIVVSDIRMRGLDGLALLDRVRVAGLPTKVILITGHATDELAREALARGAFAFIAKPFKTEQVRAAIEAAARTLGEGAARAGSPT